MDVFLTLSLLIGFGLLGVSFVLAIVRMVMGPTLSDRIVALDLVSYISIGIIIHVCIFTDNSLYLDVALALALIAFLAVIAFARYVEMSRDNQPVSETEQK